MYGKPFPSARLIQSLAACACLLGASLAGAAGKQPFSIIGEKADSMPQPAGAAQPASVFRFACETRAYNGSRLFCYGPGAIRKAYGIDTVLAKGYDGTGQTIVIIDAYGSPTVRADLDSFSNRFGLPPASFTEIRMPGTAPFDYTDGNQVGWAEETSLDVQWAHAMAPGARIVLVVAKSNDDDDLRAAQNYAIRHKLGRIISESYGATEAGLLSDPVGRKIIERDEESYKAAVEAGITVFVSSGDWGAQDYYYGNLGPQYPASSPHVTTVGGTNLFFGSATNADPNGSYQGEVVWNDGFGASGGGISRLFEIPEFQSDGLPESKQKLLKGKRGYPDISGNAGVWGGVLVYLGFMDSVYGPGNNAFYIFGGTSASTPQWAGINAVINHARGKPLGPLNSKLYKLGGKGGHDITVGDNSYGGVTGYAATKGWDLATGWGTPDIGLINALIALPSENDD
jgi:subtilase family serine protease